jgi:outer membrane immunogenic protein
MPASHQVAPFTRRTNSGDISMKRVLGGMVMAAALSGSAFAADLGAHTYAKAPVIAATVNAWSGWYAGLNAGGVWGQADPGASVLNGPDGYFSDGNVPAVNAVAQNQSRLKPSGATIGGQVGYNWQFSNVVAGFETDVQYFRQSARTSRTGIYPFDAPDTFTFSSSVSTDWLWTFRPRIGVLLLPSFLLYATGGVAVSEMKANFAFDDTFRVQAHESGAFSKTKAGWVVGAGGEYALHNGWSVKAEYLHLDFGSESITSNNLVFGGFLVPSTVFTHSVNLRSDIVRAGVNYHF